MHNKSFPASNCAHVSARRCSIMIMGEGSIPPQAPLVASARGPLHLLAKLLPGALKGLLEHLSA